MSKMLLESTTLKAATQHSAHVPYGISQSHTKKEEDIVAQFITRISLRDQLSLVIATQQPN